ncbi:MAG: LysR substrate-binding domain-containing protein [Gammaproteobacteria bacterium]
MISHPDDLARHDCLTIQVAEPAVTWRFSRAAERVEVRFRAAVAINAADALLAAARAGLGIVMVSDWLAADDVAQGALVVVLPEFQVEPRGTPITALYPSRRYLPLKVRVFVDFLAEHCAERFACFKRA